MTHPDLSSPDGEQLIRKRVLLTGAYSSHNNGDLSMQLVMAQGLRDRGYAVTASIPFPDEDSAVYERVGVKVVPSSRRKLIRASWLILRLVIWVLMGRPIGRIKRLVIPDREARWFEESDLVIDLSGDMITEDYGPHVTYSHLLPLAMAALVGRPYAVVAQSIGPFRLMRKPAQWLLRRASVVTVRDTISLEYLVSLGLEPPTVTADLAFLLDSDASAADEAISRGLIPSGPFVGVSISNLIAHHYVSRSQKASKEKFLSEMAGALSSFSEEHDLPVVLVPQVTGPKLDKDDRVLSRDLAARMDTSVTCLEDDLNPDAIKGIIGRATVFVGARMHANIAALSSGVPTVAISYSHKTPGIMNMFGLGGYVIDIGSFSMNTLRYRLDSLMNEREVIAQRLQDELDAIRTAAERNIDIVADLLDQGAGSK